MSTPLPATAGPIVHVAPEAEEFARQRGIEPVFRRLLDATAELFPTGRIEVFTEPDVEIANYTFLVYEVFLRPEDLPDHLAARGRWDKAWQEAYPYPRQEAIVLSLRTDQP